MKNSMETLLKDVVRRLLSSFFDWKFGQMVDMLQSFLSFILDQLLGILLHIIFRNILSHPLQRTFGSQTVFNVLLLYRSMF